MVKSTGFVLGLDPTILEHESCVMFLWYKLQGLSNYIIIMNDVVNSCFHLHWYSKKISTFQYHSYMDTVSL